MIWCRVDILTHNYIGKSYQPRAAARPHNVNTLRPRQYRRHFPDDTFKWIFLNENVRISIKISLKFVPKGPINKIPALVQIMAWRRPGAKPSSEPMMVRLLMHICVTWPHNVNEATPCSSLDTVTMGPVLQKLANKNKSTIVLFIPINAYLYSIQT